MSFFKLLYIVLLQVPLIDQEVDSLKNELLVVSGSKKAIVLNELFKRYANNQPLVALEYANEALELATTIGDSSAMASSYNNLGVLYKNWGQFDDALDNYIKALKIQEKQNYTDALAYTYSNIGTIHSLLEEYDTALEYFEKANTQFKAIGHQLREIGSLSNIGNVYFSKGNLDKALDYYSEAVEKYESLEDHSNAFVPFISIGNVYFRKKEYDKARAYYESAYDLEQFIKNENGKITALLNIGNTYREQEKYPDAQRYYSNALALAQEKNNLVLLVSIYEAIAETYFRQNDSFLAYSFLKLHNNAKDSLRKQEGARRIAELESAFELEKQQVEIDRLATLNEVQQLEIENDRIIILSIVIISILGVGLTIVVFKEYRNTRRNKLLLEQQHNKLEIQSKIIEDKNRSITESIDYAQSVQNSLLEFNLFDKNKYEGFVLYLPKDIVSGDFYWSYSTNKYDFVVAGDCTGHGVAGAFMTVVGITELEQIVPASPNINPAEIIKALNCNISRTLSNTSNDNSDHGMDLAVCKINYDKKWLEFAGAKRPIYVVRRGELIEYKGSKVELCTTPDALDIEAIKIPFEIGDKLYLFSDGFPDQFGGPKGKKYMTRKFRDLILTTSELKMEDQKQRLQKEFKSWKGDTEQTDDIIVLGIQL